MRKKMRLALPGEPRRSWRSRCRRARIGNKRSRWGCTSCCTDLSHGRPEPGHGTCALYQSAWRPGRSAAHCFGASVQDGSAHQRSANVGAEVQVLAKGDKKCRSHEWRRSDRYEVTQITLISTSASSRVW